MSRVWITNYAGHDYKAAEEYGEQVFITKGYVSFQSLDRVKYQITDAIRGSDPEDWLLISGRPLISIIAAIAWLLKHGQVKILNWDQKTDTYRSLTITVENMQQMMQVIGGYST